MTLNQPKYVVVALAPEYVRHVVSRAYERVRGTALPILHLHVSLSYSFFLTQGHGEEWLISALAKMHFSTISAWISQLSYFTQKDSRILYAHIEPKAEFVHIHQNLLSLLRPGVEYDTTIYEGGVLPRYEPHMSFDYQFDGDMYTLEALRHESIQAFFDVSHLSILKIDSDSIRVL